ncbi:LysR family transcriptional regulator [Lactococcus taiwanensis]|uniref:LysR family transcriptional regulator n=1 Tax=Lactococcus taiwanensis TaxID=1151742 RepID=UPI0023F54B99|nr:LysR family transcriptional regulator [Lactococcus taiwanensis]
MELRVLRYFWTVATVGTVSAAAEKLFITQPTLSRQIKDLELELDTQLFIRDGKHLVLTEDGQFLKIKAEEILQLASNTERVFSDRKKEELTGHLTIGALGGLTTVKIAQTLQNLTNIYPNFTFTILSGNADDIKYKLDNGLVDIAFLIEPASTEKYNVERLDVVEQWVLLTHEDSELAELEYITPEILRKQRLIISERSEVREYFADWMGCKVSDLNIVGGFNLGFHIFEMSRAGIGEVVVTEGALIRNYPDLKTIPLRPEVYTHSLLVWKKNLPLTPATKAFIKEYLKEE